MRLITSIRDGQERLGAWIDGDRQAVDLATASAMLDGHSLPAFASMQALIDAGAAGLDRARQLLDKPPDEAVFAPSRGAILAPIPRPLQIRDCLCFPDHLRGSKRVIGERLIREAPDPAQKRGELEAAGYFDVPPSFYEYPVYYISNRLSVVGPDVDVVWPTYSTFIDYELEWAAIIGKFGSQIPKDKARDHIFGYTIFNDWSARDEQLKVMGGALNVGPGQGKDFANGMGPCLVTADEIPDPYNLVMTARINGREVSRGSSSGMHYRFEDLIAHLSRANVLYPGEVICSGTVGGGCSIEADLTVMPGDVIELEVERIGTLRNRVVAPHMQSSAKT